MCATSAVVVRFDASAAGVAAGSSLVPLEIKNVSGRSCTLPEFPAVWLAASSGGPDIGAPAVQQQAQHAAALVLAPGRYAHAWLQISSAASYPARSCRPVTAHGLRASLAEAASAVFVTAVVPTCSKVPHGASILAVYPVQAGAARRGTAP